MVSTDRISAFDVVMNEAVPGKGEILNLMSKFWLEKTKHIIPNHFVCSVDDLKNREDIDMNLFWERESHYHRFRRVCCTAEGCKTQTVRVDRWLRRPHVVENTIKAWLAHNGILKEDARPASMTVDLYMSQVVPVNTCRPCAMCRNRHRHTLYTSLASCCCDLNFFWSGGPTSSEEVSSFSSDSMAAAASSDPSSSRACAAGSW